MFRGGKKKTKPARDPCGSRRGRVPVVYLYTIRIPRYEYVEYTRIIYRGAVVGRFFPPSFFVPTSVVRFAPLASIYVYDDVRVKREIKIKSMSTNGPSWYRRKKTANVKSCSFQNVTMSDGETRSDAKRSTITRAAVNVRRARFMNRGGGNESTIV